MQLTNAHVFITGASRGLGLCIAQAFHAKGARVSLVARNEEELEGVAATLGNGAVACPADLTVKADRERALAAARAAHGPIDVLVNNAGVGAYKGMLDCSEEELVRTIDVNFTALVLLTRSVVGEMVERKKGHIINIASDLGRKPLAKMAVYAASKHAVVGFSQSVAREFREDGVKSTVITPGMINTYFGGGKPNEKAGAWQLRPEEIADTLVYIASQPANVLIDELSIHPLGQDF